jgi:hypothetical protein
MRLPLLRESPPTFMERLVGRRRARQVRRGLGFAAVGFGLALLRPKPRYRPAGTLLILGAVLLGLVGAVIIRPIG